MKPPFGAKRGEAQGDVLDRARPERSGGVTAAESDRPRDGAPAPHAELAAWLDALELDEASAPPAPSPAGTPSHVASREAAELELALSEVSARREAAAATLYVSRAPRSLAAPPPARFDARALAERLLQESQQHAILEAEPLELLAAQLGTDALSEELIARLLEGMVAGPFGSDELAVRGSAERGLLALLALQLYVHEAKTRAPRPLPEGSPPVSSEPRVVRDERLLELLATPHEASRPLGERRPRGRPRR